MHADGHVELLGALPDYFTGTGFIEKQFLFSEQGFLGRQACPRIVDLG